MPACEDEQRAFDIASDRYKDGVDTYLDVITAQQTLLSNQRQAVQIHGQQFVTAVYLVKALGGGWSRRCRAPPRGTRLAPGLLSLRQRLDGGRRRHGVSTE